MVKLQFDSNKQFKITLPKSLILAKGWNKGDQLDVKLDSEGNIVLVKKRNEGKERDEKRAGEKRGESE